VANQTPDPAAPSQDATPDTPRALWAPWRMAYIGGAKDGACPFCRALETGDLVVHRGERAFVLMNLYPYNNGHVMVAPVLHLAGLEDLDQETSIEVFDLTRRSIAALRATEHPDGFNVGINLGRAAGAGIEGHLHQHIVPRWNGDTNFMPVLAGAKTIGEALEETLAKLRAAF
jgi:ATP adenylyltransferase